MWRQHAARRAALIVGIVLVAACAGWAVLAQTLVTPACELADPPSNAGYLECAETPTTPSPG